jgi:hypothetical protein
LRDQVFGVLDEMMQEQRQMREEQRQRMDRQDQVLRLLLTYQGILIPAYFTEQPTVVPPPEPVQDPAGAAQIPDPPM